MLLDTQGEWHGLRTAADLFRNPAEPSLAEKGYYWLRAFELYEERLATGKAPHKTKRSLLKFMERNARFLSASPAALREQFRVKYAKWLASGRDANALKDARPEKSGNFAPAIPAPDLDAVIADAVLHRNGQVAPAWRAARDHGRLSPETAGRFLVNPASKSHVPRAIMQKVGPEVARLEDIHHGPRRHKLNGAHLTRDWSGICSMDWIQGDDFTLNHYVAVPDGRGGWLRTRGQTILFIDCRSTFILGFAFISAKSYAGAQIRTAIIKICDQHGLPRRGFYFENGTWRNSKLITGAAHASPLSDAEMEMGLRQLGLEFVHARLPRSKPVERVGGMLQNIMQALPGYVGRCEMLERFERTQKTLLAIDAGRVDPLEHLLTDEEYTGKIAECCAVYNAEKQDGQMTGGLSPEEAFARYQSPNDPPVKLGPEFRYLLANQKKRVRVGRNGIVFTYGKTTYRYRNAETGRRVGEELLAWFSPECPEILTVTNLEQRNPFSLPRSHDVPAMDAPADVMEREMGFIAAHQRPTVERYRVLTSKYAIPFRRTVADGQTVALGREMAGQRAEIETRIRKSEQQNTTIQKAARKTGLPIPPEHMRDADTAENMRRLNELLAPETTL